MLSIDGKCLFFHSVFSNVAMRNDSLLKAGGVSFVIPFILITTCFALWGFANDITNPMVKAFSKIFRMSTTEGSLVQVAFYGGYALMALPAALFIRRFSFKAGVVLGLGLYALGAFLFFPAKLTGDYYPFLLAYLVMTCGLSVLETSCNPYILSMGPAESATRRLNLAQSFNPLGSLLGMFVAMNFIQNRLNPLDTAGRALIDDDAFEAMKNHDLDVLMTPYLAVGIVILVMLVVIALTRMPADRDTGESPRLWDTLKHLAGMARYREGVVAQFFYIGAQIMCWTFIIQLGTKVFMAEGMDEKSAEILSQQYNIVAMVLFCCSRFLCTYLMKFFRPGKVLSLFAFVAALLTVGVILGEGRMSLYCLVGVSACMSLMFPTIYGIALEGMGSEAKFGTAGLIMSIVGGAVLPPFQAMIIDMESVGGFSAVNLSFVLPLISFVVVLAYGLRTIRR